MEERRLYGRLNVATLRRRVSARRPRRDGIVLAAGRLGRTNAALLDAFQHVDVEATWAPQLSGRLRIGGDAVVLGRLDVLPTLDGIEPGLEELGRLGARGVTLLNPPEALLASHDKMATARRLRRARVPAPSAAVVVDASDGTPPLPPPVVVKPRFGSWGTDVHRCETVDEYAACLDELRSRPWFAAHGALVQELVEPRGYDLRVIVACGAVVGAVARHALEGEWRTNVALGAVRRPVRPSERALQLALAAADAVAGDLVGVDLLPVAGADFVVLEVNGAVDFTNEYSWNDDDVFVRAALRLAFAARLARATERPALLPQPAAAPSFGAAWARSGAA